MKLHSKWSKHSEGYILWQTTHFWKIWTSWRPMLWHTIAWTGIVWYSPPQYSKKESVIDFLSKVRKENRGKGILMVLDNFKSHKAKEVTQEAERRGKELVFLPPYSPDLNPIEYVWKSIKRGISATFIRHITDMRSVIKEAFHRLSRKISFAGGWVE